MATLTPYTLANIRSAAGSLAIPYCMQTIGVSPGAAFHERAEGSRRLVALHREEHDIVGLPFDLANVTHRRYGNDLGTCR